MKLNTFIFLHEDGRKLTLDIEIYNLRTCRQDLWNLITEKGDRGFFLNKESQKRWHEFMGWLIEWEIEDNYRINKA